MASTIVELEMFKPGTESWLESKVDFSHNTMIYLNRDARHFYRVAQELIEHKAWELYFDDEPKTWERFLQEAVGVKNLEETLQILSGVESALRAGVIGPIPAALAKSMYEGTQAIAETAKPAMKHGGDRTKTEQGDNCNLDKHRGNSAEYLASVIARDHPDVHEAMKEGKYRSVRQAAIEAGIIKPNDQWTAPGPINKLAEAIVRRYTTQQIEQLKELLP